MKTTALIAEDEPLLAQALKAELSHAWPALEVLAIVGDGLSAVKTALALQPDVLFFDIRMPGLDGLDAAADLADTWPTDGLKPFPQLVFVTAYDAHAVRAFELQAVDYVLKPVQPARLAKTVEKLQQRPLARPTAQLTPMLNQLRSLLAERDSSAIKPTPLTMIQASVGQQIRMVPVAEVLFFEAADKYVRVVTAEREYLIRTPLKDLMPQLDVTVFWQIHRGTLVRASAIEGVTRDEAGRATLTLKGYEGGLAVSRLYMHLFKAM
jgi:DNA-binding LytR/AlgR family response regulator